MSGCAGISRCRHGSCRSCSLCHRHSAHGSTERLELSRYIHEQVGFRRFEICGKEKGLFLRTAGFVAMTGAIVPSCGELKERLARSRPFSFAIELPETHILLLSRSWRSKWVSLLGAGSSRASKQEAEARLLSALGYFFTDRAIAPAPLETKAPPRNDTNETMSNWTMSRFSRKTQPPIAKAMTAIPTTMYRSQRCNRASRICCSVRRDIASTFLADTPCKKSVTALTVSGCSNFCNRSPHHRIPSGIAGSLEVSCSRFFGLFDESTVIDLYLHESACAAAGGHGCQRDIPHLRKTIAVSRLKAQKPLPKSARHLGFALFEVARSPLVDPTEWYAHRDGLRRAQPVKGDGLNMKETREKASTPKCHICGERQGTECIYDETGLEYLICVVCDNQMEWHIDVPIEAV